MIFKKVMRERERERERENGRHDIADWIFKRGRPLKEQKILFFTMREEWNFLI